MLGRLKVEGIHAFHISSKKKGIKNISMAEKTKERNRKQPDGSYFKGCTETVGIESIILDHLDSVL
jgi:hypothetical protein